MHIHVFKSLYNTYSCYSKLCINLIRNHVILKFVYKDDTYLHYSKVHIIKADLRYHCIIE